jgi:hypothetical protein
MQNNFKIAHVGVTDYHKFPEVLVEINAPRVSGTVSFTFNSEEGVMVQTPRRGGLVVHGVELYGTTSLHPHGWHDDEDAHYYRDHWRRQRRDEHGWLARCYGYHNWTRRDDFKNASDAADQRIREVIEQAMVYVLKQCPGIMLDATKNNRRLALKDAEQKVRKLEQQLAEMQRELQAAQAELADVMTPSQEAQ